MGVLSKILEPIGTAFNDIMGVSSSAKQQSKLQLGLQKDAQEFTKWQMRNAHQAEVEDLKKAGLNPVLSAGGDGAGGTPSMGSASTGVASDPISIITNLMNSAKSWERTDKEIEKMTADIKNETNLTNAQIKNMGQTFDINEPNEDIAKALKWWNSTWIGKGTAVLGDIIGRVSPFTAQAVSASNAKRVAKSIEKPKTYIKK